MSETPISPLRARVNEDMSEPVISIQWAMRKLGEKTQNDYVRHVKTFSTVPGHSG